MPTEPKQDRNVEARASELREVYRVEQFGDGSGIWFVDSWNEVISTVANGLYSSVEPHDLEEVRQMLADGVDGNEGWNGNSVVLQFEDGSTSVERFVLATNSRPSVVAPMAGDAAKGVVELLEALKPIQEELDEKTVGYDLMDGSWNEDATFEISLTVKEINALHLALSATSSHGEKGIELLREWWAHHFDRTIGGWTVEFAEKVRKVLGISPIIDSSGHPIKSPEMLHDFNATGERQGESGEMARVGEGDGELAREIKELLAKHDDKHIKGVNCHYCCSWREDAFKLIKEHATAILDASSNAERLTKAEGLLGELIEHHQASENAVYSVDSKPITAAKRFLAPRDESSSTEGEGMWLIERGQAVNHSPTVWWCGGDKRAAFGEDEMKNWTADANKARRFKTWEEAKSLAQQLFGFGPPSKATFTITEHVFI